MKKWISIVVIIIIVVGAGFWFYSSKQGNDPVAAQVMTTTVEKGDIEVSISGSGSVASVYSEDITGTSSGEVDEVLVEVDDVVEEGDELVSFTDGSDPITAAHDGTITSLSVEDGSSIQGSSTVIGHLTDYTSLQTVLSVDELDISSLKEGQKAEITASAFEDETFKGTVTNVAKEGTSENGSSTFSVTIHFDDSKDLLIGMSTEVTVVTDSKTDVLYVPIESVSIDGDEKYVTLQESTGDDAKTTKQVVETGINDDENIEITSGLEEGQSVQLAITISAGSETSGGRGEMGGMGGSGGFPGGDSGSGMPSGFTPPSGGGGMGGE